MNIENRVRVVIIYRFQSWVDFFSQPFPPPPHQKMQVWINQNISQMYVDFVKLFQMKQNTRWKRLSGVFQQEWNKGDLGILHKMEMMAAAIVPLYPLVRALNWDVGDPMFESQL